MSSPLPANCRAALEAFCETLAGDAAGRAGRPTVPEVADRIERRIGKLVPQVHVETIRFLKRLARPGGVFRFGGGWSRFARLHHTEREMVVRRVLTGQQFKGAGIARSLCRQVLFLLAANGQRPTFGADGPEPTEATRDEPGLRVATLKSGQTKLACDWLVAGAGPAGCIMAAELAETGQSVLLVDRGQLLPVGRSLDEAAASGQLLETWNGWSTQPDAVVVTNARTFGGGSVVNWGTCLDPPEWLLADWRQRTGFDFVRNDGFRHSHFAVRRRLEVAASELTCPFDQQMGRAAKELGLPFRLTWNNVAGCQSCCNCQSGCPSGAKRDMRRTWLVDAERLGVFLLPGCEITKLELSGRTARLARAMLADEEGQPRAVEIRFRNVVLAGGALHTPSILLRSGFVSPHLGRHLSLHPSVIVPAVFREILPGGIGPLQAWVSQFSESASLATRYMIERSLFSPGLAAMSLPFRSSRELAVMIDTHPFWAGLLVLARDGGDGEVRIGKRGETVLEYWTSPQSLAALEEGVAVAAEWLTKAGAEAVYGPNWDFRQRANRPPPVWDGHPVAAEKSLTSREAFKVISAHQMGTCRMGDSPQSGVVDLTGRVFGLENVFVADASVFPSASGVNPLLTVCALAHFLAQQIKGLAVPRAFV